MTQTQTYQHIDNLFRKSYGKMVSLLLSRYGAGELALIENALMEAFYSALKTWPYNQLPDNPEAWIYTVSSRKMIDALRKKDRHFEILDSSNERFEEDEINIHNSEEIEDAQLRLLFLVCHPELKKKDQLAFMLKTVSGFGIREIAAALLQEPETIKKRLTRARDYIRKHDLKFAWPGKSDIANRLEMVHSALYLLFNEGFFSTHPDKRVRKDFCLEAMQLCKLLSDHKLANANTMALMSLMCYHISRFESRIDASGELVILERQDRNTWDPYFVKLGHHYLGRSSDLTDKKTMYQIEAMISCTHCVAKSLEDTNWSLLELLYRKLLEYKPGELIKMNLVVVYLMSNQLMKAKSLFESIREGDLKNYKSNYYILGFKLYKKLKDDYLSKYWVEKALQSDNAEHVKSIIKDIEEN